MSPGGLDNRRLLRFAMISLMFILLFSSYANPQLVVSQVSDANDILTDSTSVDIEQDTVISESPETPLEFNSPITFQLNSTFDNISYSVDIAEPGLLLINWSFEVTSAGFTGPNFFFWKNESSVRYVPQLDQNVHGEEVRDQIRTWWDLFPGFTFQENREIFVVNTGYIDLIFELDWQNTIDNITVTIETSWEHSFGNPTPVSTGQNFTLDWMEDNVWEGALLSIPEAGYYSIELESYLPYNISTGYAGPLDIDVPERVFFLSKAKGTHYSMDSPSYWDYIPEHFISVGSAATSYWSDDDLVPLRQGDYYVLGMSGLFTHLNGTTLNVTINVEQFSVIHLDPNESLDLKFNANEPLTPRYVAVYLPEGNLSSIRFSNPVGGNWTVSSKYYPSMLQAVPSLTYMKYPDSEYTTEERFNDIFVMANPGMMMESTIRTTLVTGEPWSWLYQPYGFKSTYTNGELASYVMNPMYTMLPFQMLYFEISATPASFTFSDTFDVTLSIDTEPFIELDESVTTTTFNSTHGPIIEFYQFSVQSGYTYNVTATPTEYTSEGIVAFAILPSASTFDQWSIVDPPYLAMTTSDAPSSYSLMAQTTNRTASIEFIAAIDAEIYLYGAGAGLSLGDCTEAELRVEEIPPISVEFGEALPLSTQEMDVFDFQVDLIDGYDYELTIQLTPAVGEAFVTFFDDEGVNPFATTEEEIWLEVEASEYLYKTFTLSSHHTGKAAMGLILEGSVTITWDVIDTVPPELSIISPLEGNRYKLGNITIEFSAEDNIELKALNISIGDNIVELNLTATSYDWVVESMGVYEIVLTAEDTHGNLATSEIFVIIEYETYLSLEILVFSGLGTFGGIVVIGILVSRRRGGM
ncbi:MAG: hypothetical protein RTV31_00405 [Candidatus Thorarchaeota archaeon]